MNWDEFAKMYPDVLGDHDIVETKPKAMVLNKHHGNIPADAYYIGRGSGWGNEYSHLPNTAAKYKVATREEAVQCFEKDLDARIQSEGMPLINALASLHGRQLVCFCAPKACHGDVLVKKALWAFNYLKEQPKLQAVDTPPWEDEPPAPAVQPQESIPLIGIIGTAGRDKTIPMNQSHWIWMVTDANKRLPDQCIAVSGGAAWADHIAVALFLGGRVQGLRLHLPAPFDMDNCCFVGPRNSAASAANYYHDLFSRAIGESSLAHIKLAIERGAYVTEQPAGHGYRGMFARNNIVASEVVGLLAYTFGTGPEPADGGTKDTWDKCQGIKLHVPLPR